MRRSVIIFLTLLLVCSFAMSLGGTKVAEFLPPGPSASGVVKLAEVAQPNQFGMIMKGCV